MISLCIPMFNESRIVCATAKTLSAELSLIASDLGLDYEIIFIDDGSRDGCRKLLEEFIKNESLPKIRVIGYDCNRGKGCAIREGIGAASGDYIIYTDCDLAYGTEPIKRAVTELGKYDCVIGTRNLTKDGYEGYSFIRRLASKTYIKLLSLVAGFRHSDSQCGFKSFRGEAAHKIFSLCETDSFAFDFEALMIASKMDFSIGELPVKIVNHRESTVHIAKDAVNMLGDIIKIKKRLRRMSF